MEFKYLQTRKELRNFIKFYFHIYKKDSSFVDTDVFILKDLLFNKTQIAKDMSIIPVATFNCGKKICQCILFANDSAEELFLGYFDALEHKHDEVQFLLAQAKKIAFKYKKKKIIIGINGHISCGVGILQDNFEQKATFDSRYCKNWYKDYFSHLLSRDLTTYIKHLKPKKQYTFMSNKSNITYRFFDTKNFNSEMEKFSNLCNQTLCVTDFYYPMKSYHMQNLLAGMKYFLKKENLIFAMSEGKEVGYLFWHPDYNELFCAGKKNNLLLVFFKYLFKKIKKCKINAIGVLKEYQNSRALSVLISTFAKCSSEYEVLETTFIWNSNKESSALANKRMTPYKHYSVYEMEILYD